MKNRIKRMYLLGILIAAVGLGIGYAFITEVILNKENINLTSPSTDSNFIVKFIEKSDNKTMYSNINRLANNNTIIDISNLTSKEKKASSYVNKGGLSANFSVKGIKQGEKAVFTYYIANLSKGLNADVRLSDITNKNQEYFNVTVTPEEVIHLSVGDSHKVVITVLCLKEKENADTTGTFAVTFTSLRNNK